MSYRQICASLVYYYVLIFMYLTLLRPLPHRLSLLTTLFRICWLIWLIISSTHILFIVVNDGYDKVSFMVGNMLFSMSILTNVVSFIEAMLKERQRQEVLRLERIVDELLQRQVDLSAVELKVYLKAFRLLATQTIFDVIHLGIAATGYRSPIFPIAVVLTIVQRSRYIQILLAIDRQIERSACMIEALDTLVQMNRRKRKYALDIWQPYAAWEYDQLNALRIIQGRICELYQGVNNCFGWSIIVLLFTAFFTVVSNTFWCIITINNDLIIVKLVYNMMTMFRLGTLAATLMKFGNRSQKKNILVSGRIFKLAKPFGNKTYNDLVSDFSLQCLREGLTINVKGFLTLDVTVLGKITALSVTYLIILVQLMASEEEINETMGNKFMGNITRD